MLKIDLRDIITEEFQNQIQDSFAFATGFGVVFVDSEGNHIGEGSNFTSFCSAINKTAEGANYCSLSNRKAINIAIKTKKPCIYVCHAGLINIEIPLIYNGNYIGGITAGQVLGLDMDIYPKDTVVSSFTWLDSLEAAKYFKEIKTLTRQQIEATATALSNISNYIIQNTLYNKLQDSLIKEHEKTLIYEKKQIEMEHQLKIAELDALQKQVTPHFIFNVISSISRLISIQDYKKASKMLDAFSKMMRQNVSNTQSTITLQQELNYITSYLSIQKIRFSERIKYEIRVDNEILLIPIPFFSLQPLVENAIEHGLLPLADGGKIKLSCSCTNTHYSIEIKDNGKGMNKHKLEEIQASLLLDRNNNSNSHVGLRNCYNRFKLTYGNKATFHIYSEINKGTSIQIEIAK